MDKEILFNRIFDALSASEIKPIKNSKINKLVNAMEINMDLIINIKVKTM
jgi:hypothetical protein